VGIENPVHLVFIAVVALVVLGPKRLPEMARALGKGMREFREAMSGERQEESDKPEPPGAS
jgi:sec-independent protein translocase protein TatA